MRVAAGIAIFVLGGAALLLAGPHDDGDESFVAVCGVAIPLLAGIVAARWSAIGLSVLMIAPGIVLIENSSGEMTEAALYSSLAVAVVVVAALLAAGAWIGISLRARGPDSPAA